MAPKPKKPAEGEVDLFGEFMKRYNKSVKELEVRKIDEVPDAEEDIPPNECWNFTKEFDPMAFRVLWSSLRGPADERPKAYDRIRAIRVWKCCRAPTEDDPHAPGDDAVRSICQLYLDMQPSPATVEVQFVDTGVTALGCEFLGKTFGPSGNKVVEKLVLDFNQFGAAGVEQLALGLSQNEKLRFLSLDYCGIGEEGGQFLAHILMFVRCSIETLSLKGNYLGVRGVLDVLNGAKRSKKLKQLDLFDNKFTATQEIIDTLKELFRENTMLEHYDLSGNQISDESAQKLVLEMLGKTHLKTVRVPARCSAKTWEALEYQLNAAKKGGKKKKGKKK